MAFEFKQSEIQPGELTKNAPIDVPTIYVDGFGSVTLNRSVVKVGFTEQVAGKDGMPEWRFTVNLAIGMQQLKKLHETLGAILEDIAQKRSSGQIDF